jgi:hypothetical protein
MSNVIELSTVARPTRSSSDQEAPATVAAFVPHALTPRQERRRGKRELPSAATETAKNFRLRTARKDVWWRAERATEYWRARMEWESVLENSQRYGIADSASFPPAPDNRIARVTRWREAVVQQLLTPAPDLAAITWKRAKLAGKEITHLPIKAERIEQAIAEDVAFLAAHPARRFNKQAVVHRREFKAAMRQRIREVAAARGLSEADITPALKLKHQELGGFCKTYGVNLAWCSKAAGPCSSPSLGPCFGATPMTSTE